MFYRPEYLGLFGNSWVPPQLPTFFPLLSHSQYGHPPHRRAADPGVGTHCQLPLRRDSNAAEGSNSGY
jgi:hypothetical protein